MDAPGPNELNQIKLALDIYQAQYSATDKLWAYFSTVTLGVVGFSVASDKVGKSLREAIVVAAAYVCFCVGNFQALSLSQETLVKFAELVRTVGANNKLDLSSVQSIPTQTIQTFYWTVVIVVAAGIVGISYWRHRKAKAEAAAAVGV